MYRMMFNSDALMIGLVVLLLFGAISLYLYMYVQQVDQKVNLLESILLEVKITSELKSFELPATEDEPEKPYTPYEPDAVIEVESEPLAPFKDEDVEELPLIEVKEEKPQPVQYESYSLKELQNLARSKGITPGVMKKPQLVEALKGLESGLQSGQNGSSLQGGAVGSSSFLETSASVSNEL
jgi:hypothetical protein